MSTTLPQFPNTLYPNNIDVPVSVNESPANAKMADRVDYRDYVEAIDFNTLRDAVLALESTLGESPQVAYDPDNPDIPKPYVTVTGRIKALETLNVTYYDLRYGGAGYHDLTTKPTILSHTHSGAAGTASQIDLTAHVANQLPKANIQLDTTKPGALTAYDIPVVGTTTIAAALDTKLNISGGTVQGNLAITKPTGSPTPQSFSNTGTTQFSSFFEAWYQNMATGGGGTLVTLADAWQGSAIKNTVKNVAAPGARTTLCGVSTSILRYNMYSIIYRIYVATVPSDPGAEMFRLEAQDSGKTIQTRTVLAQDLIPGWNTVSFTAKHSQCTNNSITFSMSYNTMITTDIYCDGITVVPTHTAIWG